MIRKTYKKMHIAYKLKLLHTQDFTFKICKKLLLKGFFLKVVYLLLFGNQSCLFYGFGSIKKKKLFILLFGLLTHMEKVDNQIQSKVCLCYPMSMNNNVKHWTFPSVLLKVSFFLPLFLFSI